MKVGFDVISDLNLESSENFSWDHKATSLYCIVCGNISGDLLVVRDVLKKLSKCYRGVFYVSGAIEHDNYYKIRIRNQEIDLICKSIPGVIFLFNYVIIIDGVAIVGINGWLHNVDTKLDLISEILIEKARANDSLYLSTTIEKLQLHLEVKSIIVVSNSVPDLQFYYGTENDYLHELAPLTESLRFDSEDKIKYWVYGGSSIKNDVVMDGVNFIANPCYNLLNYTAHRIEL